jgi:hypothetical protein
MAFLMQHKQRILFKMPQNVIETLVTAWEILCKTNGTCSNNFNGQDLMKDEYVIQHRQ